MEIQIKTLQNQFTEQSARAQKLVDQCAQILKMMQNIQETIQNPPNSPNSPGNSPPSNNSLHPNQPRYIGFSGGEDDDGMVFVQVSKEGLKHIEVEDTHDKAEHLFRHRDTHFSLLEAISVGHLTATDFIKFICRGFAAVLRIIALLDKSLPEGHAISLYSR